MNHKCGIHQLKWVYSFHYRGVNLQITGYIPIPMAGIALFNDDNKIAVIDHSFPQYKELLETLGQLKGEPRYRVELPDRKGV